MCTCNNNSSCSCGSLITTSKGPTGPSGADGAPGSIWRDGTGVPSNGLGVNGDYYLNDANGDVYLKSDGTYSIVANIKGPTGTTGTTGATGSDGGDGQYGGYSTKYFFDTSTGSGPAFGDIRFNNTTYTSVTTIYVHETNYDGTNVSNFLSTFEVNGYIRIFVEYDSSKFWLGKITALVDSGTYRTITVDYILHHGTIPENEHIILTYQGPGLTGDTGDRGLKGRGVGVMVTANTGVAPTNLEFATEYAGVDGFESPYNVWQAGDIWIDVLP